MYCEEVEYRLKNLKVSGCDLIDDDKTFIFELLHNTKVEDFKISDELAKTVISKWVDTAPDAQLTEPVRAYLSALRLPHIKLAKALNSSSTFSRERKVEVGKDVDISQVQTAEQFYNSL